VPLTICYDDTCALCRAAARGLKRLERKRGWTFVGLREPGPGECPVPGAVGARLRDALHVVEDDGRTFRGFDAVRRLLRGSPWTRLPALLLFLPGAAPLGREVYGLVARHRHRLWPRRGIGPT
jgi:predicted DCC family thiol-disulfide oxidoreductase YuxK